MPKKGMKDFMANCLIKIRSALFGNKTPTDKKKELLERMIAKGMKVGNNVVMHPDTQIDPNYSYLISIGSNIIINRGVIILAHDATIGPLIKGGQYGRLGKVEIKDNVVIGSNVVILPGVTIGPNVVISSGSVVNKDIPPNSCIAGVPARFYQSYDKFIDFHKEKMKESYVVSGKELFKKDTDPKLIKKIIDECDKNNIVYVDQIGDNLKNTNLVVINGPK